MNIRDSRFSYTNRAVRFSGKIRFGIVGCGAITENAHLPAALSSSLVELTALSDSNESRLRFVARQFGLSCPILTDYRETFGHVDAVILALPNHLHAPIGYDFLTHGIHVLCEKPLASSVNECEQLCRAARASESVLGVGYYTRFFPSTELTRQLVEAEFLGEIRSFDYEFGTEGGWESVSGYNLIWSQAGGGVLVISGSHFIDRMLHIFGDADVISYSDDSRGGPETNCVATFRVSVAGKSVYGRVRLSKTHRLANRLRVVGEKGVLEVPEGESRSVTHLPDGNKLRHQITCPKIGVPLGDENYFRVQLDDFVRAIEAGTAPTVTGEQGARSVAITERCYQIATRIKEPWCDANVDRFRLFSGKREILHT